MRSKPMNHKVPNWPLCANEDVDYWCSPAADNADQLLPYSGLQPWTGHGAAWSVIRGTWGGGEAGDKTHTLEAGCS